MGSRDALPIRALPRVFLEHASFIDNAFHLPDDELKKFRNVLRLSNGDQIGVLLGDGALHRCELRDNKAVLVERIEIATEARRAVHLAFAFPKGDKTDEIVRMTTELGVNSLTLFPADRSIVKWDSKKSSEKLRRLKTITREACEVSFRSKLPAIAVESSLQQVLKSAHNTFVLSESETVQRSLCDSVVSVNECMLVLGPEGGWSPTEHSLIGERAVTLGPRVLRVVTAAVAAVAIAVTPER